MPFCAEHQRDFKDWGHHVKRNHGGVEPTGTKASGLTAPQPEAAKPTPAAERDEPKGFNITVRIQAHGPAPLAHSNFARARKSSTLIATGAEVKKGDTVKWLMSRTQAEELKAGAKEFTVLGYQILRYDGAHGAWENKKEEPKR